MPELPEVETVRRTLCPHLVGNRILQVTVHERRLRTPIATRLLTSRLPGRKVLAVRRRGKYLLVDIEGDLVLLLHLGMSGSLTICSRSAPLLKHDHAVFELSTGKTLRFNDPRRFGLVELLERAEERKNPHLRTLGIEPLESEFTPEFLFAATRKVRAPIKSFLMDARHVVGIGNIYACEALFAAGIHPKLAAGRLGLSQTAVLVAKVRDVLSRAIDGRGTTLRDYGDADGRKGEFASELLVYGREGEACPVCGTGIRRLVQSGRSTFYCRHCQRQR